MGEWRSVGSLAIDAIRELLARYASPDKLKEPPGEGTSIDDNGVQVLYRNSTPGVVRFQGVTWDDIHWGVEVDFRGFSRGYTERMLHNLEEGLLAKRRERSLYVPVLGR